MSSGGQGGPVAAAARARVLDGYDSVSHLRQARDYERVLDLIRSAPESLADLGCGTGVMLAAALQRWSRLGFCLGVDGVPNRVETARARVGDRGEVRLADLRDMAPLDRRFDAMTMTSVLHWLYPDEARVFRWMADHLAPDGCVVLTTHHPEPEGAVGGEDLVVRDALQAIGSNVAGWADLPPISRRTRGADEIQELLSAEFEVEMADMRSEPMTVDSASQHTDFHVATFGDYFSRLVPGRESDFLHAVGQAALQRMERDGHVYRITVRQWRGTRR